MNILLLGISDGTHILSQLLLEDPKVKSVRHFGAWEDSESTDRYLPLPLNRHLPVYAQKDQLLESVNYPDIDLIIPTPLFYLLYKDLQNKIKEAGIPFLGPNPEIAYLEWSRVASKSLFKKLGIPSPDYAVYSAEEFKDKFLSIKRPFVFKFEKEDRNGLQTVIVTDENVNAEYQTLIKIGHKRLYENIYGAFTDQKFIVEEFIEGSREYSYHVICNNVSWQYIGSARDYKRINENDRGHNTVGVGAYAPVDINPLVHEYAERIIKHCKTYTGFLYLGIIEDKDGKPYVLEINTRPGNPELQVIFPLIENNLTDLFYAAATQQPIPNITFKNKAAASVRLFCQNYKTGASFPVMHPELTVEDAKKENMYLGLSSARHILNSSLCAVDDTIEKASDRIYKYLEDKELHEFTYRKDIGHFK